MGHSPSTGLSPRLRGNRNALQRYGRRRGSIPAPAGEPSPRPSARRRRRVYPRACGGTARIRCPCCVLGGLSPRLRGNLASPGKPFISARSIPAPAGEPATSSGRGLGCRVYPRACGGTLAAYLACISAYGLSPRLRGNRQPAGRGAHRRGSIPAPAGGTGMSGASPKVARGLSPRLRGNL